VPGWMEIFKYFKADELIEKTPGKKKPGLGH
jgi:hypothetical protein